MARRYPVAVDELTVIAEPFLDAIVMDVLASGAYASSGFAARRLMIFVVGSLRPESALGDSGKDSPCTLDANVGPWINRW